MAKMVIQAIIIFFFMNGARIFAEDAVTNRLKFAIITFDAIGDSSIDTETLTETFQTELVNSGKNDFSVVERTQLAKIIEEQKLQLSGLTEQDALKVGSLAGADRIITGKISMYEGIYIVNIKAIHTTTAEIVFADRLNSPNKEGLLDLMTVSAERFVRKYRGEDVPPYKSAEISAKKDISQSQSDSKIEDNDIIKKRTNTGSRDSGASSAVEIGIFVPDFSTTNKIFTSANRSALGGQLNFKFPGEGGFQFNLGINYLSGKYTDNLNLSHSSYGIGLLWNPIHSQYILIGAGVGYFLGWGDAEYLAKEGTKFVYHFNQDTFNYNVEAGVHITQNFILKLEWGAKNSRGIRFKDDSKEYEGGAYSIRTESKKALNAPAEIYYLYNEDGFSYKFWALKFDFLFD